MDKRLAPTQSHLLPHHANPGGAKSDARFERFFRTFRLLLIAYGILLVGTGLLAVLIAN